MGNALSSIIASLATLTAVTRHSNRGTCTVRPRNCIQIAKFRACLYSNRGQSGWERTQHRTSLRVVCARAGARRLRREGGQAAADASETSTSATPQAASPAISHWCAFCIQIADKFYRKRHPRFDYKCPRFQCNESAVKKRTMLKNKGRQSAN
jgi:hypothetical protein